MKAKISKYSQETVTDRRKPRVVHLPPTIDADSPTEAARRLRQRLKSVEKQIENYKGFSTKRSEILKATKDEYAHRVKKEVTNGN